MKPHTSSQLALLPATPHICPMCGGVEPHWALLQNNHGVNNGRIGGYPPGEHPIYGAYCLAQYNRLARGEPA